MIGVLSEIMKLKPLFKMLDYVNDRPGMFRVENVKDLSFLILGYSMSAIEDKDLAYFENFSEFVQNKFQITNGQNWCQIIEFYSSSNLNSLELFRNCLNEFIDLRITSTN